MRVTFAQIGDRTALVLSREAADLPKLKVGDTLYLSETPQGYALTRCDPKFEEQMSAAKEGMRRYRNALRELAGWMSHEEAEELRRSVKVFEEIPEGD